MVRGFRNVLFGGLFLATLTGPGHIWLRSMPILNLAEEIARYLPGGDTGGNSAARARSCGGAGRGGRVHRRAVWRLRQVKGERSRSFGREPPPERRWRGPGQGRELVSLKRSPRPGSVSFSIWELQPCEADAVDDGNAQRANARRIGSNHPKRRSRCESAWNKAFVASNLHKLRRSVRASPP